MIRTHKTTGIRLLRVFRKAAAVVAVCSMLSVTGISSFANSMVCPIDDLVEKFTPHECDELLPNVPENVALYKGKRGGCPKANVRALQTVLAHFGFYDDTVDGSFGKNTQLAVKRAQQAWGLVIDGSAGANTLKRVNLVVSEHNKGVISRRDPNSEFVVFPLNGYIISSTFQPQHRTDVRSNWGHMGIDMAPSGSFEVFSIYSGVVKSTGYNSSTGNFIEIESIYKNQIFYSYYFHLADYSISVKEGDCVAGGQVIAFAGNTGLNSSGVHLHLQVTNKSCRNSDNTFHVNYRGSYVSSETQREWKSFTTSRNITFYNPELILNAKSFDAVLG